MDEDSPETREFIRARRDTSLPPGEEVADYEEYTHLYWESWGDPVIRWLFSTVGVAMIFDDHDVHDDWNTSIAWLRGDARQAVVGGADRGGALSSYWVYQHIGNLAPGRARASSTCSGRCATAMTPASCCAVRARGRPRQQRQPLELLPRPRPRRAWSCSTRARAGCSASAPRKIVDDKEWEWIDEQARGDFDHLLLVDTLPFLLIPALHHVEAWNEAVCAGAWGRAADAGSGERIRRALDLEHWAAFNESFRRMEDLLTEVASGRARLAAGDDRRRSPVTSTTPTWPRSASRGVPAPKVPSTRQSARRSGTRSTRTSARIVRDAPSVPAMERVLRPLARAAGVPDPKIRWRLAQGPTFDNQFATLELEGRSAVLRIETNRARRGRQPQHRDVAGAEARLDCRAPPRGVGSAASQRPGTAPDLAGSDPDTPAPMMPETERIAAALEPELRRVIDMTMERVAEIEQKTMRGARELMASSRQNSQEVIDRSARLGDRAEILIGTVNEMTPALRAEVDDVTDSLRSLHGLKVELPEEPSQEPEPEQLRSDLAPDAPEPAPPTPDPEIEPSPELTTMFRDQITRMREDGKSRDEAERVLLRFRLGHRFLGMLDDIYLSGPPRRRGRRKRQPFARFRRGA